ncbi:MAG: ComEC/Rec2 family competence protein [Hyphomicrobiales bacterium]|nr:ComEC/Rec2 family competence protein [Hyphomicrobiales bacterium]
MVDPTGARGRADTWRPRIVGTASRIWSPPEWLTSLARASRERAREWVAAEVGPGRLVAWLAVAFASGVLVYFAADHEPAVWAAASAVTVAFAVAWLCRARPFAFSAALVGAALAAGFAIAVVRGALIAHPVLSTATWNVDIAGFIEVREERERSDRVVVRVVSMAAPRLNETLERVRVSVRKGTAPAVGKFVEFKARLSPPLGPLRPGGYDFARDMYFHQIGASGFVLGRIRELEPPHPPRAWLHYAMTIDGMREGIDRRIRAVLPGDQGAIASALITGKRDAITASVNEAMYVSSLAHVLSISGYHMAVVAGLVFFLVRALLALAPPLVSRYPIKKWSAGAALMAAAFYLLLSGAEIATQRSFVMVAVVLVGVMLDRPTLTFRTLTIAAFAVLLLAPEAVIHPSFQMSFAATLALVAGYQHGLPWSRGGRETTLRARIALWGVSELAGLVLVSLLAGAATMPFIAYHFHRFSPYGLLGNLLAMPIVSLWVMPVGIVGLALMPFGLDGHCWWLMGQGIDWMITVATWVAALPGALGRIAAFGPGALILCTVGMVVLCLLKTPLRLIGTLLVLAAVVMMVRAPQPDILIAADAAAFAVRGPDGRLTVSKPEADTFAIREWLAADADPRTPNDATLGGGIRCDAAGCVGRLRDGTPVAFARTIEAFAEDCRRAAVVISAREALADCDALVVDRAVVRRSGAMTLRRTGASFEISTTRSAGYDRPWAPRRAVSAESSTLGRSAPQPRDATPRHEDLEPGD